MTSAETGALAAAAAQRVCTVGPDEVLAVRVDPGDNGSPELEELIDGLREAAVRFRVSIMVIPCEQFAVLTRSEAGAAAAAAGGQVT